MNNLWVIDMTIGKMNEKSWGLKKGKSADDNQHKSGKKNRVHVMFQKRRRWNKKLGKFEWSKKGSQDIFSARCD